MVVNVVSTTVAVVFCAISCLFKYFVPLFTRVNNAAGTIGNPANQCPTSTTMLHTADKPNRYEVGHQANRPNEEGYRSNSASELKNILDKKATVERVNIAPLKYFKHFDM